ncbi:lycopene cyclase [Streptomyces armeniacus]|uniref:Lycopene cyclase n=1 Tax=Streptomyces armeniacus TaxID=83291 RepID=A0A345XM71_9ACTN|nr:lycopene cyclase family protein [Streptomyces armeniacus]AXK32737.1 lycopene cyclase [Streptomyces armeniacus]
MRDTDVIIVGAGAAGLSLARRLTGLRTEGRTPLSVMLVDAPAGPLRPAERTWCFWEEPGGEYDDLVAAHWDQLRITGAEGRPLLRRVAPFQYKMLRSTAFAEWTSERLAKAGCLRCDLTVETVRDVAGGAEVKGRGEDGTDVSLRARWVFDSRPRTPPAARTALRQHFRGWFVQTERTMFDTATADLMDFRTRQPEHGLSFGYVLPLGPCAALVEYTEFSRTVLGVEDYERALRHYSGDVLGLGDLTVTAVEQGVIPMTDARFPRRAGRSVFLIGAAGGATRPSTGYTFAPIQRETRSIADALGRGRVPPAHGPHHARARSVDAVLLRALDTGRVDGKDLLTRLFREVPMERLLRFLDGRTRLREDVQIGLHTPMLPMLRTALELPALRRRPPG